MSTPRTDRPTRLLFTCEHATRHVPPAYSHLFRSHQRVLASHRGFDPGALALAERLVEAFPAASPLLATSVSRLLVECNRSEHHPRLFSEFTRHLDAAELTRLLAAYYHPHRAAVLDRLHRGLRSARCVLHIGVHTFTPILDGVVRTADVGILYNPARTAEADVAARWARAIRAIDPTCRVRRNYPYRGSSDGLTTSLRRQLPTDRYLGLELEVNNSLLTRGAGERTRTHRLIAESLRAALDML